MKDEGKSKSPWGLGDAHFGDESVHFLIRKKSTIFLCEKPENNRTYIVDSHINTHIYR